MTAKVLGHTDLDRRTPLLDELMPTYDVRERHATVVHAPAERVFSAIRTADLTAHPVTRVLLALRGLGVAPRSGIGAFERSGFRIVAERAPEELVIGLLGKFWTPGGGICPDVSRAHFGAGPPAGFALAGWNFTVCPRDERSCKLATETRVRCAPDTRAKFRAYWFVVRPGSGLIRRAMLQAIRRDAERH